MARRCLFHRTAAHSSRTDFQLFWSSLNRSPFQQTVTEMHFPHHPLFSRGSQVFLFGSYFFSFEYDAHEALHHSETNIFSQPTILSKNKTKMKEVVLGISILFVSRRSLKQEISCGRLSGTLMTEEFLDAEVDGVSFKTFALSIHSLSTMTSLSSL